MKKLMILVMLAAFALPTLAQQQQEQWQTSTMQTSGSAYSSQVTPVGATAAPSEATTTANYAPGRPGTVKRGGQSGRNPGDVTTGSTESPIGDAVLPLLALACVYMVYSAVRRKRSARV